MTTFLLKRVTFLIFIEFFFFSVIPVGAQLSEVNSRNLIAQMHKTIQEKEEVVTKLQSQVDGLLNKLEQNKAFVEKYDELKDQLQVLMDERDQAIRQAAVADTTKNQVTSELNVLKRQAEGLATPFEERINLLNRRIQELGVQVLSKDKEISQLREERKELAQSFRVAEDRVRGIEVDLLKKINEVRNPLQDKIRQLESQMAELRFANISQSSEILQLRQLRASLESDRTEIEKKLNLKEKQLVLIQSEMGKMELKVATLEKDYADSSKLSEVNSDAMLNFESEKKKLVKSISELSSTVESLQGRLQESELSSKEMTKEIMSQQMLTNRQQKDLDQLRKENTKYKADIEETRQIVEKHKNEAAQYKSQLSEQKNIKTAFEKDIKELGRKLDSSQEALLTVNSENSRLSTLVKQMETESDQLRVQIKDVLSEKKTLSSSNEKISQELSALKADVMDKESQLLRLHATVEEKDSTMSWLISRNETITEKLTAREKAFADSQRKNDDLQAELKSVENSIPEKIQQLRKSWEVDLEKVKSHSLDLERKLSEKIKFLSDAKQKTLELERNLDRITKISQETNTELETKKEELEKLKISIPQTIQSVKAPLEDKINLLKSKLEDQEKSNVSISRQFDQQMATLAKESANLDLARETITKKNDEIKILKNSIPQEIVAVRRPLEEQANALKQVVAAKESDLRILSSEYDQLKSEHKRLTIDFDKAQSENVQLKKEFSSLQGSLSEKLELAKKPLQQQIDNLRAKYDEQLASRQNQIVDFQTTLKQTQEQEAQLEKNVDILTNALAEQKQKNSIFEMNRDSLQKDKENLENTINALKSAQQDTKQQLVKATKDIEKKNKLVLELQSQVEIAQQELVQAKKDFPQQLLSVKIPLEQTIGDLKNQVKEAQEQNRGLLSRKQELEIQIREFESDLTKLNNEIVHEKSRLVKELDLSKQLATQVKVLADEKQQIIKNNDSLEKTLQALTQKADNQSATIAKLESSIPEKVEAVRQPLIEKFNILSKERQGLEIKIKNLNEENEKHVQTIRELVKSVQSANLTISEQKADFEKVKASIPEQIKKVQERLESEKTTLSDSLATLEQTNTTAVNDVKKLTKENADLLSSLKNFETKYDHIQQKFTEAQEQISKLNKSIPLKITAARSPLEEEILKLKNSFAQERNQLESLTLQSRLKADNDISAKNIIIEELNDTLKGLKIIHSEKLKELTETLKNSEESFQQEKSVAQKMIVDLQKNNTDIQLEIKQRDQLVDRMAGEIQDLKNKINAFENKIEEKKSELVQTERLQIDTAKQLSTVQKDYEKINAELDKKNQEYLEYQEQMTAKIKAEKARLEMANQELASKIDLLENALREKETAFDKVQAEKSLYKTKNVDMVNLLQKETDKFQENEDNWQKKIADLQTIASESDIQLTEAKNQVKSFEKEMARLQSQNVQLVKLTEDKDKLNESLKLEQKKITAQISDQIAKSVSPYEAKVTTLTQENAKLQNELNATRKELTDSSKEVNSLKKVKTQVESRNESLASKITQLETSLSENKASLSARIDQVKAPLLQQIETLTADKSQLQSQISDVRSGYTTEQKKSEKLDMQLTQTKAELSKVQQDLTRTQASYEQLQLEMPEALAKARQPLQNKIDSIEGDLILLTENEKSTKQTIVDLSKQNKELQQNLKDLNNQKAQLEEKNQATMIELVEIKNSLPMSVNEAKIPLQKSIEFLEKRLLTAEKTQETNEQEMFTMQKILEQTKTEVVNLTSQLEKERQQVAELKSNASKINEKLQSDFKIQQAQLETEKKSTDNLSNQIKDLKNQLVKQEDKNNALTKSLSETKTAYQKLNQNISSRIKDEKEPLLGRINELVEESKKYKIAMVDQQKQISLLENQLKQKQEQSLKLTESLSEQEREIAQLKQNLNALSGNVSLNEEQWVAEINSYKEKIADIESKLSLVSSEKVKKLEDKISSLLSDLTEQKKLLLDTENKLVNMQTDRNILEGAQKQQSEVYESISAENIKLLATIEKLKNEKDQLIKKINATINDAEGPIMEQLRVFQSETEKLRNMMTSLESENEILRKFRDQNKERQSKLSEVARQAQGEKTALQEEIKNLESKLSQNQSLITARQSSIISLESKTEDLENQIKVLHKENSEKNKLIKATQEEKFILNESGLYNEAIIKDLTSEVKRLRSLLKESESTLKISAEKSESQWQDKLEIAEKQIKEIINKNRLLETQLENLGTINERYVQELKVQNEKVSTLQEKHALLESDYDRLITNKSDASGEESEKLLERIEFLEKSLLLTRSEKSAQQKDLDDLTDENNNLNRQLKKLQSTEQQTVASLEKQAIDLKKQLEKSQEDEIEKNNHIKKIKLDYLELQKRFADLQAGKNRNENETVKNLQTQLNEAKEIINERQQAIHELRDSHSNLKDEIEIQRKKLTEQLEEIKTELTVSQQTRKNQQDALQQAQQIFINKDKVIDQIDSQRNRLENDLVHNQEKIKLLEDELLILRAENEANHKKSETNAKFLRNEIKDALDLIDQQAQ